MGFLEGGTECVQVLSTLTEFMYCPRESSSRRIGNLVINDVDCQPSGSHHQCLEPSKKRARCHNWVSGALTCLNCHENRKDMQSEC